MGQFTEEELRTLLITVCMQAQQWLVDFCEAKIKRDEMSEKFCKEQSEKLLELQRKIRDMIESN